VNAHQRSGLLLEGAIVYTLDIVGGLDTDSLSAPSPCPDWDVRALVDHLIDSLSVLSAGFATGHLLPTPYSSRPRTPSDALIAAFSTAACDLLTRPPTRSPHRFLTIVDAVLPADVAAVTGAVEMAVHGWDIAHACGQPRRIPRLIATEMLELAPLLVPAFIRPTLFAEPVPIPSHAAPGDRLLAFLGRAP
jgi:uncharacterized protein (TIGR03086 family)